MPSLEPTESVGARLIGLSVAAVVHLSHGSTKVRQTLDKQMLIVGKLSYIDTLGFEEVLSFKCRAEVYLQYR